MKYSPGWEAANSFARAMAASRLGKESIHRGAPVGSLRKRSKGAIMVGNESTRLTPVSSQD
jgi:hypothetical protein